MPPREEESVDGHCVSVMLERGRAEIAPVVLALDRAGLAVESLELKEPTLDDVFLAKTGRHLEGAGEEQTEQ
jgi:ABC-2 type transport system ATP-binding protein